MFAVVCAIALAVGPGGDASSAHEAIYPHERVFKPETVEEALKRADRGAGGWFDLRGLTEKFAAQQALVKSLGQAMQAGAGGATDAKAPFDLKQIEPMARMLQEQLKENPQLLERILNDPAHRRTLEQLIKQLGPKLSGFGDDQQGRLTPEAQKTLASLIAELQKKVPGLTQQNGASSQAEPRPPIVGDGPGGQRSTSPGPAQPSRQREPQRPARGPGERSATVEKLLHAAKQMSKAGTPLAQSQTLQRVIGRLSERAANGGGAVKPSLPAELRELIDGIGWNRVQQALPSVQRWTGAARRRARSMLPDALRSASLPSLPRLRGRLPELSAPRLTPSIPRVSGFAAPKVDPSGLAKGGAVAVVLFAIALGVAILSKGKLRRWSVTQRCRRLLVDSSLSPRERICLVFEQLALEMLGDSARTNNHRRIAERLRRSSDHSVTALAADKLADVYELARYTPAGETVPAESVDLVERHFVMMLR